MNDESEKQPEIVEMSDLTQRTLRALRQCGRDVLIRHKRDGFPVVSWVDGKVVLIPPEEIVIPPEVE